MPTERPEFNAELHCAMGLYNLFYRAQEQQYVENLSVSHCRWTVVGGFRRYSVNPIPSVNLETLDDAVEESRVPQKWGFFVKREFESQPTMYTLNQDGETLECLEAFVEQMKDISRFELFTGRQRIFDVREKSVIDYGPLSAPEIDLLYSILSEQATPK